MMSVIKGIMYLFILRLFCFLVTDLIQIFPVVATVSACVIVTFVVTKIVVKVRWRMKLS